MTLEALATALRRKEVAGYVGVARVTIGTWQRQYGTGGLAVSAEKMRSVVNEAGGRSAWQETPGLVDEPALFSVRGLLVRVPALAIVLHSTT